MTKEFNGFRVWPVIALACVLSFQNCGFQASDDSGGSGSASLSSNEVSVTVNQFKTFQPVLATRAISCLACHANVGSNVVSDFGAGENYYLNANVDWKGNYYGDHAQSTRTINLHDGAKMMVPRVALPSVVQSQTGFSLLRDYIANEFSLSPYATTKTTVVEEKSSIKIATPTADRIRQVFGNPAQDLLFVPSNSSSPGMTGYQFDQIQRILEVNSTHNFVCDGDLFVNGTVVFKNANVRNLAGCRIYATGSIVIHDGVRSVAYSSDSANPLHNLQLMSSRAILMGLGRMRNAAGAHCEPAGWYATNGDRPDSLVGRIEFIKDHHGYTRSAPNAASLDQLRATLQTEMAKISGLYDSSCGPQGRAVELSRIFLASPYIQSRFQGNVSGIIVGEVVLMALGQFKFKFDPVFNQATIFPRIAETELLDIR